MLFRQDGSVAFAYKPSGTPTWQPFGAGTANTDAAGNATITVDLQAPAPYDFDAFFSGVQGQYDPSNHSELLGLFLAQKTTLGPLVATPQ
jgi:hypothetical protein